jgi:hypothetical protein
MVVMQKFQPEMDLVMEPVMETEVDEATRPISLMP